MKKVIKLTEADLNRIVKRVMTEDISENSLYNEVMDVLSNSNSSREEEIYVLKHILKQKEGHGHVTKDKVKKHFGK